VLRRRGSETFQRQLEALGYTVTLDQIEQAPITGQPHAEAQAELCPIVSLALACTAMSPLLGGGGRSRWREVGGQVSRAHLEEIDRLGQAAESPGAKAPETDPLRERLDDRRAHG
jgi:hypothetical protein